MIKIILHGCGGRMGHFVADMADKATDLEIVAGVDPVVTEADRARFSYPVFPGIKDCHIKGDVIIDFGTASAIDALLDYVEDTKIPCIICTTGLSEAQLSRLEAVSSKAAVLRSANMSYGVNLLFRMLKEYSAALSAAGFDIEVVEKHHNQKLDAPSGTAIALGDAINEGLKKQGEPFEFVFDRSNRREKRPKEEIGFSAIRGGSIVGDHDVIFAGKDEVITLSHRAYSRELFANGALMAARAMAGKAQGLYTMEDIV